ncbi:MAG: PAS domain S-box protein, partial [Coleofasciculaceae cyanobacterium]
ANISIFVVLIWQNAKILDRLDHRRQQVEDELQETLVKLQALIQASPLAIIVLDNEAKLKLWSPAAESIFGWSESEALGHFVPFVPPDKIEELQKLHQLKLQGGVLKNVEVQQRKKDGSIIDIAIWGAPLPDARGNINSTMAVIADITERKRTQEALKASEEQFRQLAENIRDVFWSLDLQQKQFLYVSPAYEKIWGRSCADLLENTQNWLATIHPDDRQSLKDSFVARMNREDFADLPWSEFDKTYRIVRPDGSVCWIRERGFPIKNEQGETYRIAGIAEDITERKRTEEELRETTQTLQALIQACPLAITVFSLDNGKVKLWNPAAETIFGWSELEVLGHFLPTVPEDKQEEFLANLGSVRQGNQLTGIEVQRQKKGGVPIDINVWAAPLVDAKGNVSCMSIVADISERKRLEAERKRLLESEQAARSEAETANRLKDEFLAVLSHELRTPMNAILGWAQLLRTRKFEAAATERALETIERNSKSLSQLIEDVLDVSKIVRGKLLLKINPVELDSVIKSAIETLQPTAQLKEIHIESFLDDSVGLVLGDGNRLQQVFWNLLSNAVKFTPKGGRVEVHLSAVRGELAGVNLATRFIQEEISEATPQIAQSTDYVQIQVKDTGKGIAPEFLPHVFERFRQENSSTTRTYGGLGLGLAIVRQLVELHGGMVWADSCGEGKGASFSVLLPLILPN